MLAKITNLPQIKLAGLLAGIVLVVGGVAFFFINQQSKNSEIDQTLERLSLVSDGVEATNQTQRAAGLAAKGKYPVAARLADKANDDLANLRQEVGTKGADVEVQGSVASGAKASGQVEASAKALLAARKAERGDDLSRLRQARRDLKQSSRQIRNLTRQLNRAKRQLSRAIAALTAQLEELDSLDEPVREDAEKAAGQLEQSTPPGLEEGIIEQSEAESVLLIKRLDWIEPRPGPRSCGKSPTGAELLINEGKVSCRDASFVFNNSRGPNEAIAPSGWDCSLFGSDLDGRPILGAAGYSCVRTDSARITINKGGAAPTSIVCDAPPGVTDLVATAAAGCGEAENIAGRWAEFYGEYPELPGGGGTSFPVVEGEDPIYNCFIRTGGEVTCTYRSSGLDGGVEDPSRKINFVYRG